MGPLLQKWTGLADVKPFEIVKYLAANVGGRISAVLTFVCSTLWGLSIFLPETWQPYIWHLFWMCCGYLLCVLFWRSGRNQKLLVSTVAQLTLQNPASPDVSADVAVQREINKQQAIASGVRTPPKGGA